MKELYNQQLQELSGQFLAHTIFGWAVTYPLMGPIIKGSAHGWMLRYPVTLSIALFMGVQASNWNRPSKVFHEIVCQPAPHGSYVRRSLKENFPIWWEATSANMHTAGLSLPEMNEYDRSIEMPKTTTNFDAQSL